MNGPSGEMSAPDPLRFPEPTGEVAGFVSRSLAGWDDDAPGVVEDAPPRAGDPGTVILTCANCGAELVERKCKLICRCGYFLSCSDYY